MSLSLLLLSRFSQQSWAPQGLLTVSAVRLTAEHTVQTLSGKQKSHAIHKYRSTSTPNRPLAYATTYSGPAHVCMPIACLVT
jgi:hypothetical protein